MLDDLSSFECRLGADKEKFLRTQCIDFQQRNLCRTYLIIDEEASEGNGPAILAYFNLAINFMRVNEEVPKKIREKLNVQRKRPTIPCYLIGQLAKNDRYKDEIKGSEVLDYAMGYIVEAQQIVSGCCVRVDCRDHDKLRSSYETNGFIYIQMNGDGDLCQYVKMVPPMVHE